jgi:hypothetical protein
MKNYTGSIALTKLTHAVQEMKGKDGKPKKCIIIPVDDNYLVAGKDNAFYLPVSVVVRDEQDQYGQNGFISQQVGSKTYKDASEAQREEFKKLPILGNIKDWGSSVSNDSSGATAEFTSPEDDDLPF